MENDRYAVILQYDPNHIEIHDKVVACLSRLDQGAAERFGKTKSTGRLIVKRSTDLETAKRLRHMLRETGALCSIQELPSPLPPAHRNDRQTAHRLPESRPQTNPLLMRCPNCGYEQPPVSECRACGIIISKARPRPEFESIKKPPAQKGLPRNPVQTQLLNAVRHHTSPLLAIIKKIQHPIGVQQLTSWARRVADRLIRCAIVFIAALILQIGLLSLGKMLWFLYVSTAAGQYYLEKLPEKAEMFQRIAHADALNLGWDTTLTVLLVGLLLGCAAQVLHLIRYLYESQGIIGKLALWILPSMGLTAWIVSQKHPFPEYGLAASLVALPTLCMLSSCLYLAQTTLPELGDFRKIIAIIVKNREKSWRTIINKLRLWLDTTKQVY